MPALLLLTLPGLAAAGEPATATPDGSAGRGSVALFPFEGFDLPAELESVPIELGARVGDRLRSLGYSVTEPVLLLRDMLIAVDCERFDGRCARQIGRNLEVDFVVVGKVVVDTGGEVLVRIRRWRTRDGTLLADISEVVPEAIELARERYASLVEMATGTARRASGHGGAARLPRMLGPGIAVTGLGGLLLGAALGTGLAATAERRRSDRSPLKTAEDFELAVRHRNRSRTLTTATWIFVGVGAVAAVGGSLMIILDRLGAGARRTALLPTFAVLPTGDGVVAVIGLSTRPR